jgi:hypothetical protein
LVSSPNRELESATSTAHAANTSGLKSTKDHVVGSSALAKDGATAHQASADSNDLIDLGRNLNAKNPSALETLKASESLKSLGETLDFLKALGAPETPKALEETLESPKVSKFPKASVPSKDDIKTFNELIAIGCTMDLAGLESLLKERRELAGSDPELVSEYYGEASLIMTDCPALKDAETTVQSALENQYYEVLRCLQRHPIWKDESQELWYWAMIYGTPAWNKVAFNETGFSWSSFGEMFFKLDDTELFERVRHEPYFKDISEDDICKNIIKFDSVNILTNLYPTMVKKVAKNVDLIVEYSPPRIISQLVPPHAVKSAGQLQKLFAAGYDQIPKRCLRLQNGVPTIHTDCAEWLAEHNCLSLVKEMFRHNPDFKYEYNRLYYYAISSGSLDVMNWLHYMSGVQRPPLWLVREATRKGHLDTIEWIVDEFRDQINWKAVIEESYDSWRSHKVIDYLENEAKVTLKPEIALYRLAAKGDLTGLQTALSKPTGDFPWQEVANGAARGGHAEIVQWVHKESPRILPENNAVEDAYKMGDFSVLKKVYEIDSTRVASGYKDGKIDARECFFYAAMHKNSEAMGWILNNPLKDKLLNASDIYPFDSDVPEEACLRALKQIAETKGRVVVDEKMMPRAARRGHVKVFQWLREQGLAITAEVARVAVIYLKVEILKAIHAIDPSLVCTVKIANEAANSHVVWKFNALDWMHKTCKILPTDLDDKDVKEWVEERQQK